MNETKNETAAHAKPPAAAKRIRIPLLESLRLVFSYARGKIADQVPSVIFIVSYLIVFQVFVLGLPLQDALALAGGLAMVVLGLAFFLEGLALGLMPLGETIGVKLPKRRALPFVLAFAFLLGFGATLAEPAVSALKVAGSAVKAWDAPLLFLVLNKYSYLLVLAIGLGVGIAVVLGVLRFYRGWSLKPMIFGIVGLALAMTVAASLNPNLAFLTGLSWDSGGITTGPVTVPLVLALGLGISRIVGKGDSPLSGFGVVTLASAVPVITVLGLGFALSLSSPQPMGDVAFASPRNQAAVRLFADRDEYRAYVVAHAGPAARLALFGGNAAAQSAYYRKLLDEPRLRCGQFGPQDDDYQRWLVSAASPSEQALFFGTPMALAQAKQHYLNGARPVDAAGALAAVGVASGQAVLPLCLFLLFTLLVVLRERLKRPDEVFFGIALALVGMFFLNAGIEFGLSRLGNSVGSALPAAIKAIDLPEDTKVIPGFSLANVYRSIGTDGQEHEFFYLQQGLQKREIPFDRAAWHADSATYDLVPQRGPLLGRGSENWGLAILLVFGFLMGYGATMAEPALFTMGKAVEDITVGIFRRKRLMQAVAVGVGIGIAFGILKIVFDISLVWLIVPPYLLLFVLTALSDESYVNIAWDSAGVTTGPVTVPLVLAMGLGLGTQLGVPEGFGILAMASAFPILVVLAMGLVLKRQERRRLGTDDGGEGGA